ncbi:MAG: DNA-binding response regulator [Acidobacteria bacterium]|nr:MAG: DNA-binding response regulator [Acidobacteriota bacterium]
MNRVFIVAASPLARAGLENLLAARNFEVAGTAPNIDALVGELPDAAVDAILMDSSGEPFESLLDSVITSGLASDFNVVLLAEAASPAASAEALRAGIRAVLPNDISPDQLAAALQAVSSGLVVLHPANVHSAVPAASVAPRPLDELVEPLTPRESEVLQMLASGLGNKEIAAKLGISDHTVKFHVASILGKLGASSRTEAVSLGIRGGLVLL